MRISVFGDIADWNMEAFSIAGIPEVYRKVIAESDYAIFNLEGPVIYENPSYQFPMARSRLPDLALKVLLGVLN